MVIPYTPYRVVWSARHQTYAARCVESLEEAVALGATPTASAGLTVRQLGHDNDVPERVISASTSERGATAGCGTPRPRRTAALVPRWRTRC